MKQISQNLYCHEDACNVYVVKSGNKALCIDFGLGKVLDDLSNIGVNTVEWVLHTHHHRDQCQGTHMAVELGAKVAVPANEYHYFAEAELFSNRRNIHHLYNMLTDHFTLRESIPVAEKLFDFSRFNWEGYEFQIIPSPGHTMGSIVLKAHIDGTWYIFSGDSIRHGAEVQTLYDLQYTYHDTDGFSNLYHSLDYMKNCGCQYLLPSHGEIIDDPKTCIEQLQLKIKEWICFYPFGVEANIDDSKIIEVAENFYCVSSSVAHSYCLLSKDGSALFIDYGTQHNQHQFPNYVGKNGGNRFIPHSLRELQQRGLKKIEAFTPTHYHDDHIAGFPYLQREHQAELWAYENMVPHLQNPRREIIGCSIIEPLKVDRVLRDGEIINWKEYEFEIRYTPGHCDYHMTMFLEHDNKRIAISGDVMFNNNRKNAEDLIQPHWNLIYLNKTTANDHHQSARSIAEFNPSIMCPGHGDPFDVNEKVLANFVDETSQIEKYLEKFVGNRSLREAMSPHWCQAIPFEQSVQIGIPFKVTVKIANYRNETMNGTVRLAISDDWKVMPASRPIHVHAGDSMEFQFELVVMEHKHSVIPVIPYGIELELNGKCIGEVGQGQVEIVR